MILALVAGSSAGAQVAHPCSDTSYVAMKGRPVDALSTREYEIFRERDRACYATARDSVSADNLILSQVEGRAAADLRSTRSWYVRGLAGGLVLGLVGATLVHNAASNSKAAPRPSDIARLEGRSPSYVQVFTETYNSHLLNKRERSAFQGGLLGAVTGVVAIVVFIAAEQP